MIADCSHRMMLTRALAVFVVVLLLSSSLATLLMYESEALEDYQHTVVYHSNLPGEGSESVTVIPSRMRPELTVLGSIQAPYNLRITLHRMLNLPMARVTVKPSSSMAWRS